MVHRNILRFEQSITDRGIRICGVFSAAGEKIFEREENSSLQFQFTADEIRLMEGNIFTYNDARGDLPSEIFSKDIIRIAVNQHLCEIRVVTRSGVYSLKPNRHEWPDFETICRTFKRNRELMDVFSFEPEFREAVRTEGLNYQEDYPWYVQHYIWKNVAQALDLTYTRIP